MPVLIIYHSIHYGNTEKIAQAMADVLKAKLVKSDEVDLDSISYYDLIGFGSGVYFGRPHKSLFELINKLPDQNGKPAFVFTTSGMGKLWPFNLLAAPLKNKLKEKNFKIVGEFNCRGWDTYPFYVRPFGGINKGRPNENDLEKAREFARNLMSK